jgi:hypothetical protein
MLTAATAVVLGVLLAVALTYQATFEAWLTDDPERFRDRVEIIIGGFALLAVPVLVASIYLWRFGHRVVETQRFPPPDTAVTRDTRILAGPPALLRGRILEGLAAITAIVSVGVPVVLWLLLGTLGNLGNL